MHRHQLPTTRLFQHEERAAAAAAKQILAGSKVG